MPSRGSGSYIEKSFGAQKEFVLAAPEKLHASGNCTSNSNRRCLGVGVSLVLGLTPAKVRDAVSLLSIIGVPPYRPDQLLDIFVDDDGMIAISTRDWLLSG